MSHSKSEMIFKKNEMTASKIVLRPSKGIELTDRFLNTLKMYERQLIIEDDIAFREMLPDMDINGKLIMHDKAGG